MLKAYQQVTNSMPIWYAGFKKLLILAFIISFDKIALITYYKTYCYISEDNSSIIGQSFSLY
jgi:hypothetical protein